MSMMDNLNFEKSAGLIVASFVLEKDCWIAAVSVLSSLSEEKREKLMQTLVLFV